MIDPNQAAYGTTDTVNVSKSIKTAVWALRTADRATRNRMPVAQGTAGDDTFSLYKREPLPTAEQLLIQRARGYPAIPIETTSTKRDRKIKKRQRKNRKAGRR